MLYTFPNEIFNQIPPSAIDLLKLFESRGAKARLVGGYVRDLLWGHFHPKACLPKQTVLDIDICIDQPPTWVIAFANKHHIKAIPTGINHGTVTLLFNDQTFEVTTLRHDIAPHGRHSDVSFNATFEEDALRRDFTINALSLDYKGNLYDYTQGLKDIKSQTIGFIGDPLTRIEEDALRIWRYFRFYATHLSPAALGKSLSDYRTPLPNYQTLKQGQAILSAERITQEFFKILRSVNAPSILPVMQSYGLLKDEQRVNCTITKEVINRLWAFESVLVPENLTLDISTKLVSLHLTGQPFCLTKQQNKNFVFLSQLNLSTNCIHNIPDMLKHTACFKPELWVDVNALCFAFHHTHHERGKRPLPPFPLQGKHLQSLNIDNAIEVNGTYTYKRILDTLKGEWFDSNCTLTLDECLTRVKTIA